MPFWPFSKSTPPTPPTPPTPASSTTSPSTTSTITSSPPPPPEPSNSASTSRPLSRDELAEAELRAFLSSLETSDLINSRQDDAPQSPWKKTPTSSPTYSPTDRARIESQKEDFESTFPTMMNCLHAFDQVWYCYSLGGQFLNVYRYGHLRDCSEKTADWRFCMRTKVYGETTRKAMIMAHYKEKAARYKKPGASSEDIWSLRKEPVEGAFMGWQEGMSGEEGTVKVGEGQTVVSSR